MRRPFLTLVRPTAFLAGATLALALGAAAADRPPGTGRAGSSPIGDVFPLVFDSETVRLDVVDDSLEVRAEFTFLCRTPTEAPIPLFFPFPVDSLLGGARMVSLAFRADAGPSVPTPWEDLQGAPGVRWWVPPCRGDSIVAESVYRQKRVTEYGRYILTTAQLWGRPLRWARFEIGLPPGAEPVELSYPFERRSERGEVIYVFEVRDFVPERDVVVRWRR